MGDDREHGSGWIEELEGCPGCAEVHFGEVCGLGEGHCIVTWAYKHFQEVQAQVEARIVKLQEEGVDGED